MKTFYKDNIERIEDVKVLLTLAQDLLLRLSASELNDAKASVRCALSDLRKGEQLLVKKCFWVLIHCARLQC